jgi:signal transduction histidine kinase
VVLDAGLPEKVIADKSKLHQILSSLLSNAIKYAHTGGIIMRVKLKDTNAEPSRHLVIEVSDTGIGITMEHFDIIFEPFTQISDSCGFIEGAGLGLALVQQ